MVKTTPRNESIATAMTESASAALAPLQTNRESLVVIARLRSKARVICARAKAATRNSIGMSQNVLATFSPRRAIGKPRPSRT